MTKQKKIKKGYKLAEDIFKYVLEKKSFIVFKKGKGKYTDDINKDCYDDKLICSFEDGKKHDEIKAEIIDALFYAMEGHFYFQKKTKDIKGYDGITGYFSLKREKYVIICFRLKN